MRMGEAMTGRMIRITSCLECPRRNHRGAFGNPGLVPFCRAKNRDLPHTIHRGYGGHPQARPTGEIPDWCPLERAQEDAR